MGYQWLKQFQKVQKLSTERQREYVDRAKARNDAYEDDEVVIHETQPLINDNQRRLQFQVLEIMRSNTMNH
ncbi:t-SNARE [Gigaspora margarita]|uniref:t-SNARE n=1 Tax=Gigaspora margarita TaxID=4874 RepID=A0A8H4AAN8_GIGMA|nr:t-SNARE [Gigaspora margarita]